MAVEWCGPCRARGRLCIAHHEVAGTPMCAECFEGKPSNGVRTELAAEVFNGKKKAEERPMAKRIDEATKAAIRKDAADGMSVEQIRIKHHVSWPSARDIVKGSVGGAARVKRGRPAKVSANAASVTPTGSVQLCDAMWAALPFESTRRRRS